MDLLNEEWVAALTFHEYVHAFDQDKWQSLYSQHPRDCAIKIQEGVGFLVEAKAYSLLTQGDFRWVRKYLRLFEYLGDPVVIENYLEPALKLYEYEVKTGNNFFVGLTLEDLNLCD